MTTSTQHEIVPYFREVASDQWRFAHRLATERFCPQSADRHPPHCSSLCLFRATADAARYTRNPSREFEPPSRSESQMLDMTVK
jgi:hypothetical protein